MKQRKFFDLLKLLLTPVLLLVLGLILMLSPDSATAVVARIIGWILVAIGVGCGLSAIGDRIAVAGKVIAALIFCGVGWWMIAHPLLLAAWIGRLVGILLMIQGIQDILYMRSLRGSVLLPVVAAIVGAVLVVLPMTTSRVVFAVIGGVVSFIGLVMLIDRIRSRRQLDEPQDPNIIDAL